MNHHGEGDEARACKQPHRLCLIIRKHSERLQKLILWEHDGVLVVSGRTMEDLKHYFKVSILPVQGCRADHGRNRDYKRSAGFLHGMVDTDICCS